ncbi:NAD(P)/FAD-dependent oxidoreductase [Streptomyces lincolnensis]|uniref:flavin-containing monooxygenase n=1 Tax=Streptomyces lincolnensis TaxID=1915 RepID=UPI001E523B7C|nr:NAD(P)/FAD-dependent oxidoreductase [Streptomyces lincolnensis]MCD7442427.1 NAD(P)/FAD-dependent oxidoreductase [Streptomyces lincolnensis]
MPPSPHPSSLPGHVDVLIVGAGISGIDAAYRVQSRCPDRSYAVLEARASLGGTWDLFRYPGVRADSDIYTLSFPFQPWTGENSMADGDEILDYLRRTVDRFGIDRRIHCSTKVVAANWSAATARWTVTAEQGGGEDGPRRSTVTCSFLYLCTGYYDYERGHDPQFPGVESFAGTVVNPQFWPDGLDHAGKRVVVIGSGATAITVVPAMARDAASMTMLQRTPTWVSALPRRDRFAARVRRRLPAGPAHRVVRARNAAYSNGFYHYCRRFPDRARTLLTRAAARRIGEEAVREHFTPPYAPWDQRVCITADADLFKAIEREEVDVVTAHIDRFVPEGIRLRSGRVLPADIVVTATGLRMLAFGHIAVSVDGEPVDPARHLLWRGTMLSDVPNFALCFGYVNLSWTMRADLTARLVCRVLKHMRRADLAAVTPPAEPGVREQPMIELASGYVRRGVRSFPRQGHRTPWRMRQTYLLDVADIARASLRRELRGVPRASVRPAADDIRTGG